MNQKKKRNPLPKTLRGKKRYWVIQFFSQQPVSQPLLWKTLRELFLSLYGSVGVAGQRLVFRGFNSQKNLLVLQCALSSGEAVPNGLLLLRQIGPVPVVPKVVFKTGVLHKALEKAGLS